MSVFNYIVEKLKSGIITFVNAVISANRDLPYHDETSLMAVGEGAYYVVGTNNKNRHGTQSKTFVSKSTLVYADSNIIIHFNDAKNTPIPIVGNVWYEFKSNIWQVFVEDLGDAGTALIYFEGVLPEEARTAH
jgi:hypothetical protein